MKKKELLKRIEKLERHIAELESRQPIVIDQPIQPCKTPAMPYRLIWPYPDGWGIGTGDPMPPNPYRITLNTAQV